MVTQNGNNYYGKSTDEKPTRTVLNGRAFIEIDTGKIYFFDEDAKEWVEWGA